MSFRNRQLLGLICFSALAVIAIAVGPAGAKNADPAQCDFDRTSPSVEHARQSFRSGQYYCARLELNSVLNVTPLENKIKADAHGLLAAVEYATTFDRRERRQKTRLQFMAAFRAFRYWRGQLEIPEYEFKQIMQDAREVTEWVYQKAEEQQVRAAEVVDTVSNIAATVDTAAASPVPEPPALSKKPWYKQWWALGSGVGLFAIAVTVLGSSGDNEVEVDISPTPIDTLPGFPPPP